MKRMIKLLLCLLLCLPLAACKDKKGSEEFAVYTKAFPSIIYRYNSFDTNFLFDHPEVYGIEKELYTLDVMSLDDFKQYHQEFSDLLDDLDDYDYDSLNEDQKITYDLLKKQEDGPDIDLETLYYLSTNYFDVQSGIQAQLPFSLWNYEFKNKKSVDSFLAVLQQAPEVFKSYTDLEVTRQEKGFGMSQVYLDGVIQSIHTITTTDQSYILNAANEKLKQAAFLSDEEKQYYQEEINTAFHNDFLQAFAQAEQALSSMKVLKTGDGELSSYTGGKAYYEDIVTSAAGVSSMEDYGKLLDGQSDKAQASLMEVLKKYPETLAYLTNADQLNETLTNIQYTKLTTSKEVIEFLEQSIGDGKLFPPIQKLDYQMNTIPDTMKDTTPAAAAYFISAFDDTSGKDEHMILNGAYQQSDFTTLAHESFPGHMYQNNYFKSVDHDILRNLLGSSGYSEGWATYTEQQVCDLSDEPGLCQIMNVNNRMVYAYVLQLDKKIHYDGISREEALAELKNNFGLEGDDATKQYEQLLTLPGIFANYHASAFRIFDLKEKAKKAWKDEYSDLRFNQAVLDLGPLPMDLLEQYLGL